MAEEQKGFEDTLKDITTDLQRILTNRAVVLKGAYERDVILYKVMQTTLEGGAGQQEIRIKKLEERLAKAGEVVEDNVQTILRLQHRIKELEAQLRELQDWDSADMPNGERVYNMGRGMIQYPFNPEGEELYCMQCSGDEGYLDECICGVDDTPTPYPYTHPIRDIPAGGGKVK
tara:strand:+ start:524 stop:1045 length:522 start_codon:yes stop_codon:yes gene_type:complete